MTEYALIIALILSIVVAVVAYRLIQGVLKFVVVIMAVASIALGAAAFLVIMDANDIRENFGSGRNLVIVDDGGKAVFAMELRGSNGSKVINRQEIDEYSKKIAAGDYDAVRDGYYKLIVISTGMIERNESSAKPDYSGEPDGFFISLAEKVFSDPVFFISEYKKGNIRVYEETAFFRAVKMVPASLVKSAASKAITKVKTAVVDKIEG